jgi:hypothetical protein
MSGGDAVNDIHISRNRYTSSFVNNTVLISKYLNDTQSLLKAIAIFQRRSSILVKKAGLIRPQ